MGIDIAVAVVLAIAFFRGYKQGFVMSIFTVVSYLVGFFVTMHLSFLVSDYLASNFNFSGKWMPIVAFILTFSTVVLLVKFLGKIVEKAMTKILPTLFNRLLGSTLWMLVGIIILSLLFQVMLSGNIFKPALLEASVTAEYLEQSGTFIKENMGEALPAVRNLFKDVDEYFRGLNLPGMTV